jgi:hypothetical protein
VNWQLLTYFGYRHGWFYDQESYVFPGRWFGLLVVGINAWGVGGTGNSRTKTIRVR